MSVRVIFTGGGTAGHVNPNLALIDELGARGHTIHYIGSRHGVERGMITARDIPYFAVYTGKLRRYFSWKNAWEPLCVVMGIVQAYALMRRLKPQVVFSKGGFVALPVVIAAWLYRVPVVAHESDFTPGLANRLSLPFVARLCVAFPAVRVPLRYQTKVCVTGTPIRTGVAQGSLARGVAYCELDATVPCVLVMGGSQGAVSINRCVRAALDELTRRYQVIHLCGKGNVEPSLLNHPRYRQFEYVDQALPDLFAASRIIISRAGANALMEILACGKPHVLIPLSRQVSRGDQIDNARYFANQGVSVVIEEEALTTTSLLQACADVEHDYAALVGKISELRVQSATTQVADVVLEEASH